MSNSSNSNRHISQIETIWPILNQAHGASKPDEMTAAQQAILSRYRPAVYRYLLACLGNSDAADELCQEFSLRIVRGDFRNANPEKGRFRDLLKSALYHLIIDYHKRRQRQMAQLGHDAPEPSADESMCDSDRQFMTTWRANLLNQTWQSLAEEERESGRPLHTVLFFRAGNPEMRSQDMALELSKQLGKELTGDWVRKWLVIARGKFAEFLLDEVAASLRDPTIDAVEQELIDLELYQYCKQAVDDWRKRLEKPPQP